MDKDVVIVGVMDKIEVWDLQNWNEYEADHEQDFERDADDLFQLGYAPNLGQNPTT